MPDRRWTAPLIFSLLSLVLLAALFLAGDPASAQTTGKLLLQPPVVEAETRPTLQPGDAFGQAGRPPARTVIYLPG